MNHSDGVKLVVTSGQEDARGETNYKKEFGYILIDWLLVIVF